MRISDWSSDVCSSDLHHSTRRSRQYLRVMPSLPMFPLGSAVVPGAGLPLHVFEDRYRALMKDCMAGDREFGVVLIERGSEVGGRSEERRVGKGCVSTCRYWGLPYN